MTDPPAFGGSAGNRKGWGQRRGSLEPSCSREWSESSSSWSQSVVARLRKKSVQLTLV